MFTRIFISYIIIVNITFCNDKIVINYDNEYKLLQSGRLRQAYKGKRQKKKEFKKLSNMNYDTKVKILKEEILKSKKKIVRGNSNHIFGLKKIENTSKINMRHFNKILELDTQKQTITVESSVTIKQILNYLIPKGFMLPIIPDMSHLTIGGIISGIGGGSASFKNGCFHDNMIECDVITADGKLWNCSSKKNAELFYALPNTLGTLAYITKLKLKIIKCKPFVCTDNYRFNNQKDFFDAIESYKKDKEIDFLDATIFSNSQFVIIAGKLINTPTKKLDNFINNKIYWKSIQKEKTHCFKLMDYIYRWDTDLYYTTMSDKIPNWLKKPFIRKFFPKWSVKYVKKLISLGIKVDASNIVQDILIPFKNMRNFYEWYDKNIALYPVYICPAQGLDKNFKFWTTDKLCDFGVGYGVTTQDDISKTRKIEKKMLELGGRKLLYSRHQMSQNDFWKIYDEVEYKRLRDKYNAKKFPDIYFKIKK